MVRNKATTAEVPIVPETTEQDSNEQIETPTFDLEPLSEEAQQTLRAWGNSTVICVQKLEQLAPQWSELIGSFFQLIKGEVQSHS